MYKEGPTYGHGGVAHAADRRRRPAGLDGDMAPVAVEERQRVHMRRALLAHRAASCSMQRSGVLKRRRARARECELRGGVHGSDVRGGSVSAC